MGDPTNPPPKKPDPFQGADAERIAETLEALARDLRSGKCRVTHISQSYPISRYWAQDKWHFFRLSDLEMSISYFTPEYRDDEERRLKEFLAANQTAEYHGVDS